MSAMHNVGVSGVIGAFWGRKSAPEASTCSPAASCGGRSRRNGSREELKRRSAHIGGTSTRLQVLLSALALCALAWSKTRSHTGWLRLSCRSDRSYLASVGHHSCPSRSSRPPQAGAEQAPAPPSLPPPATTPDAVCVAATCRRRQHEPAQQHANRRHHRQRRPRHTSAWVRGPPAAAQRALRAGVRPEQPCSRRQAQPVQATSPAALPEQRQPRRQGPGGALGVSSKPVWQQQGTIASLDFISTHNLRNPIYPA